MPVIQRDSQRHTYGDYLTWTGDQNEELVDGIAYVREPPSPVWVHQELVGAMHIQIRTALKGKPCRVCIAPLDVRLPKGNEEDEKIDTVVQPDLFIVCMPDRLDARGGRGAPDWVAEVLSPSTASHDVIIKVPAYERAGVREVWLVDPTNRMVAIYRLESGRYGRPTVQDLKGQTALTAVPGLIIDWEEALSQLEGLPGG